MRKFYLLFLLLLLSPTLFAAREESPEQEPLFGGTLLAYGAESYKPCTASIQPYFLITREGGFYDNKSTLYRDINLHEYTLWLILQAGLIKNVDAQIYCAWDYMHAAVGNRLVTEDTLLLLGFQLLESKKHYWQPNIKILLGETFPTGKFDRLNQNLDGLDVGGSGAYQTVIILAISKTYYPTCSRPFDCNFNGYYGIPVPTKVRGLSLYGGSEETKGTIFPGKEFYLNFALQYSLSYNWALGMDCDYFYQTSSTFHQAQDNTGERAALPSCDSLQLTFLIEYTLNDYFGLSAGTWFSIAGRNYSSFLSSYFTFYYFF